MSIILVMAIVTVTAIAMAIAIATSIAISIILRQARKNIVEYRRLSIPHLSS
jgi:hypothetical protein